MYWLGHKDHWTLRSAWFSLSFPIGRGQRFGLILFGRDRFFFGTFRRDYE